MVWKKRRGTKNMAPISYSGPYVITHRSQHVLGPTYDSPSKVERSFNLHYRPSGEHHYLGTFETLRAAKRAAREHADARR